MERKKIIPKDTIKGKFEYMEDETSKFDKYQIRVDDNTLVAFLYMPRVSHLLPVNISFKQEIEVENIY